MNSHSGKRYTAASTQSTRGTYRSASQTRRTTSTRSSGNRPSSTGPQRTSRPPVKKKRRPVLRFLCSATVCLAVLVLGVFYVYSYYYGMLNFSDGKFTFSGPQGGEDDFIHQGSQVSGEMGSLIEQMNSDVAQYDIISSSDVTNILLLGVDDRDDGYSARTDTMLLVSICNKTNKIYLTSFMRDTWVYIPGYGYSRMNAANAWGGPQLVMDTIEENFKIHVDRYVMVNFMTFVDVVNSVGGVEVEVTDAEVGYLNEYVRTYRAEFEDYEEQVPGGVERITGAGTYNMNGVQALAYCRIRYVGDDFERTNRQRKVIGAIFTKAKGLNLAEISGMVEVLFPQVMTNITSMEVLGMCFNVGTYLSYDLMSQRVPADGTWYNLTTSGGAQVIGIDLNANIQILRNSIYADN